MRFLREMDDAHAAVAQFPFDRVAVGEGGREPGGDLGHADKMSLRKQRGEPLSKRDKNEIRSHPTESRRRRATTSDERLVAYELAVLDAEASRGHTWCLRCRWNRRSTTVRSDNGG